MFMLGKAVATFLCAIFVLGHVGQASAASAVWNTKVSRILTDESSFGGCVVYLDDSPTDQGLDCGANPGVSVDCLGLNRSKSASNPQFSTFQLGLITQKTVRVVATDDAPKFNGFCRVTRVDIYR